MHTLAATYVMTSIIGKITIKLSVIDVVSTLFPVLYYIIHVLHYALAHRRHLIFGNVYMPHNTHVTPLPDFGHRYDNFHFGAVISVP